MDARETNILESFINMREFDRVNAADYKNLPDASAQFDVIKASIETMQDHAATQTSGVGGRAVQQKSVLDAAIRRKMKGISRTARALNINDEGFRRLFSTPNGRSGQKILAGGGAGGGGARGPRGGGGVGGGGGVINNGVPPAIPRMMRIFRGRILRGWECGRLLSKI